MKEAAGEANMTVITIVLIAVVLGVGTLIVNSMMNSTKRSSACSACGGMWKSGNCVKSDTDDSKVDYSSCLDDDGTVSA